MSATAVILFRTYQCPICGFTYDELAGIPDDGLPPGTRWEKVPQHWICPDCAAPKRQFEPIGV